MTESNEVTLLENEVLVFTKDDCSACDLTIRKLKKKGVSVKEEPLTEELRESFKQKGYGSAPVVKFRNEEWAGYNSEKLNEVFDQLGLD